MKTILTSVALCALGIQLQAQVSFTLSSTPYPGSYPQGVAAADVNGDGRLELISANSNDNTLSVLTNNGNGGFVVAHVYPVGFNPYFVLTADVNGDGKLDIICANENGNSLSVLTNDGSGGFVLASTPGVGNHPYGITAADINGDGKVDLISANTSDNTLSVLTNNGSGGFSLASSPGVGSAPVSVVAADVNGDGKLDLISANANGNSLSVLTNNGSGGFVLAHTYAVGNNPRTVVAVDVNSDGKVDLISANLNNNSLSVLTNDGSGNFTLASSPGVGSAPYGLTAADVNGDGKVDLISANFYGNTLSVLTNDGSGNFLLALSPGIGRGAECVVAADINGDGKLDLITANAYDSSLSVLTNGTPFSQTTPSCVPAPSGLVSWWPGEGNANDVVGGNNGNPTGGITYAAGEVGQAFVFNGSTSYIPVPASPSLNNIGASGSGFTIECWIKAPNTADGPILEWDSATVDGLQFWVQPNGQLFANIWDTSGNYHVFYSATGVLDPANFQHVALTYDKSSGNAFIYRNGVVVASANIGNITPQTSYAYPRIGLRSATSIGNSYYTGLIDELSLYSRALSPAEIEAIYNAGSAGKCPPAPVLPTNTCVSAPMNLVSWWPGEGNANDIVGGNNGTPVGNLTYGSGKVGQAFVLDGSTSYITVSASPSLDIGATGSGITIEGWINPKQLGPVGAAGLPIVEWDSSNNDETALWVEANYQLFADIKDTANNAHVVQSAANSISLNTFQHVAMMYDKASGAAMLYINGVMVVSNNIGSFTPLTSSPLNIGRRTGQPVGNGDTFNGLIDELSLYNRALSATEIAAIYNAGSAGKCTATPPVMPVVPVISGFEPASGTNGTLVTISGSNFSAMPTADIVYFGAVQANVLTASPTSLQVTVPVGATFAPITVTVDGLTAYADQPFMPTFAGGGQVSFTLSSSPGVGNYPFMVATVDVNGDGKVDLVCPNQFDNTISVLTNNGNGGFVTAATYAAGAGANSVATADVNGDGKPDLIVANMNANTLSVLTNNGNGGFVTAANFATGAHPISVAAADVNGDGRPDLISANYNDNTLTVLVNNGSGGFVISGTYAVGSNPYHITAADVNGDGKPDLISANSGDNSLTVLTNNGSGGFVLAGTYAVGNSPAWVTAADVNGDGKLDLISANVIGNTLTVLTNDGNGGFVISGTYKVSHGPDGPYCVTAADVNGDGKVDLISANGDDSSLTVLTNNGSGGFLTAGKFATGSEPLGVAAADVNGDGQVDLISANAYTSSLSVLTNVTQFIQPTPTCDPTPSGLISWWPGEGNANDIVGGNNGVPTGGITYASGEVGQAFVFNGSTSYIPVPASPSLDIGATGSGVTIEGWIKPNQLGPVGAAGLPIVEWDSANNDALLLWVEANYQLFADIKDTGNNPHVIQSAPNSINTNSLQHVALTYDKGSGVALLYINGAMVVSNNIGTVTPLTTQPAYTLNIGRRTGQPIGNGDTFNGLIDELGLYNRALSSAEIAAIYNAGSAGKCPPALVPPMITTQPAGQTVTIGNTATFSVIASGSTPLNFQWSLNTTNINGATNATLTLNNVQFTQAGNYTVLVANSAGSTNSIAATLTVNPLPPCDPAPSGLISWWPGEGNANDIVGGNNGTPVGNLTYGSGKVGQAFVLDGSTSYITVSASPSLDIGATGSGITIEGWINPKQLGPVGAAGLPIVEWDSSNNDETALWVEANYQLFADIKDTANNAHVVQSAANSISLNTFQHVAMMYDKASGAAMLYINGVMVVSNNIGSFTPLTSSPLNIGRRTGQPVGNGDTFNGLIDELSLYNRALSATEIAAIYNAGSAGKCAPPPPVANATATTPLVISVNNSNATVVLNGSLSYDPDGDPLTYTWYQTGSPNPLATGVIAVVVLPVGTNSITLAVSDGLASNQQTITVQVITLAQAVEQLQAAVIADVSKAQPLIATLNAALGSIDRSNPTAAINQLQAFQNQVGAQISPLDPALAQSLIDEAQSIINALSGGVASHSHLKASNQSNGKMHLNFSGMHQQVYIIEASTNMVDWQMIGVAQDQGDGTFNFDDAQSTQLPARYYRVVVP